MIEWLMNLEWDAIVQIIIIDILLGGDNAVIIALACRNLPPGIADRASSGARQERSSCA